MEENEVRELVKAYGEALGGVDLDAMVKFHADNFVSENATMLAQPEPMSNRDELREWLALFQEGFPDKELTVAGIFVDGDAAIYQWRIQGKNTGPFRRISEPTNKEIDISGCTVLHIADGQIVRERSYWDSALLLRQVGMLPEIGPDRARLELEARLADLERMVGRLALDNEMLRRPGNWWSTRSGGSGR